MSGQRFTLEVNPTLPPALARLAELAGNLRFSWHRLTRKLFESLDPSLWYAVGGNPRLFLRCVDQAVLDRAASSVTFLDEYHRVLHGFDAYLRDARPEATDEHLEPGDLVAYFCAEYGFHESFPIYSGGLGVLAGDHCKTASDMALEFVAVGLLYREGYFTQTIDADGNQVPQYRAADAADLPVERVLDAAGAPLKIRVRIGDRDVAVQLWRATAGRVGVVLLDTNVAENGEADRAITEKLYGGDREVRIQQEMVLGIGGVRALRALGLSPSVWHMNEGHAAFLGIELMCEHVARGLSIGAAREAVAAAGVFTTHTPVAAGHDVFPADMMLRHFGDYARRLGLDANAFLALGRSGGSDFNMTFLALRLSRRQNGVSRIHGGVSAQICTPAWPQIPPQDSPIGYVTNGVHVPTFLFQRWKDVFDQRFGEDWRRRVSEAGYWDKLYGLADPLFWEVRQGIKASMLRLVRARLKQGCQRNGVGDAHFRRLARWIDPEQPDVLTIGFARRFATYKRATLLFRDPQWLASIVGEAARPVVFVFAGKAHPADEPGRQMIREVHTMAQRPEFLGRVLFIEDYDMGLARSLVAGVDVWLNNPIYPLEASGTSGMKAGINGTINLSVLDGWWAEGFDGQNGWAIPSSSAEGGRRDDEDARSLYEILQDEVVPMYYDRDAAGLPKRWIQRAKRSMATLLPAFNTRRMVSNYVSGLYRPAAAQGRRLAADGAAAAVALAAWRERALAAWPGVTVRAASERPSRVDFGDRVRMQVAVNLNGLAPQDVRVELLVTRELPDGPFERPALSSFGSGREGVHVRDGREAAIELFAPTGERSADGAHLFAIECTPPWCGRLSAAVRLVPFHPLLSHPYELGLMAWL